MLLMEARARRVVGDGLKDISIKYLIYIVNIEISLCFFGSSSLV